jgi:hypothetical protein
MIYCKEHHRLFINALGQWLPFSEPPISHTFDGLKMHDVACDICNKAAQDAFKIQFPRLYTPPLISTLQLP